MTDIALGDTIDFKFATTLANVPTTLAGSPVVSAYVGNGTSPITSGVTLTVDFNAVTGLNNVRVVAAAANTFAAATNVTLVVTTGTVGGFSVVGLPVGSFSIQNSVLAAVYDPAKTAAQDPQGFKKNTARAGFEFPIVSSVDHITPQTGLTITPTRSIDGGAFGACTNTVTEIGVSGVYSYNFSAADLNGNNILFKMAPATPAGDVRLFTVVTVA